MSLASPVWGSYGLGPSHKRLDPSKIASARPAGRSCNCNGRRKRLLIPALATGASAHQARGSPARSAARRSALARQPRSIRHR
jgi:hypothetical protein